MKVKKYIYTGLSTVAMSTLVLASANITEEGCGIKDNGATSTVMPRDISSYRALEDSYINDLSTALQSQNKAKEMTSSIHSKERQILSQSGVRDQLMDDAIAEALHSSSQKTKKKGFLQKTGEKIKGIFSKSEEEINVLSLDGGGIRGIGTLSMLAVLEMKTGKKTYEMFDRIYGTSTGGLAALLLASGMSAAEVLEVYFKNADRIFNRGWYDTFTNPLGLMGANFNPVGLEGVIQEYIGDAKLSDTKIPVAVTTVNSATGSVKLLSSEDQDTRNVSMLMAGRATSAAPTYFPAQRVTTATEEFMAIDGGVAVNNPAEIGYAHLKDIYKQQGTKVKINMLSLGTGQEGLVQLHENAGKLGFGSPANIPGFFMGVKAREIEDNMHKLHKRGKIQHYGRFQFDLPYKIDLADISGSSKQKLMELAWARAHKEDFTSFIQFMREQNQKKQK
jgi:hypothetical protein